LTVPYEHMIKILGDCAKEKNIPSELVKKIYDLERDEVHLSSRNNEIELRRQIIDSLKE